MLVLRICYHTSTEIQWSLMISTKICARQIAKMYDLVRAAGGLLNLLKVNMFLNLTDIEPVRAATDKSLLYTTEGEVSDELHGLPQTNTFFILLNMGYPMNCYWKNHAMRFVSILCLHHCIHILQMYQVYVWAYCRPFQRYYICSFYAKGPKVNITYNTRYLTTNYFYDFQKLDVPCDTS